MPVMRADQLELPTGKQRHALHACQLFPSLAIPEQEQPWVCVGVKKVTAREVIFYKGDPATEIFVVRSGKVKVSASHEDGKEIIFTILGPGEVFGEMAVLEGTEHQSTATALETTELEVMDRREFLILLEKYAATSAKLLTILCARLRQTNELAHDMSFLPLSVRLAKQLWRLAKSYGVQSSHGIRINIQLYQQELGSLVGTSRESINKQFAAWQAEGLISMQQGYLIINRPDDFAERLVPSNALPPISRLA